MVLYKTGLQIRVAFSFIIFFIRFNGLLCFACYIIVYFLGVAARCGTSQE